MSWFKVDDRLHAHPKVRRAGREAMALWLLAGSHCAAYLTDGVVTLDDAVFFVGADAPELAARLVAAGLWHEHPKGWVFHDWAEYQPTREAELAKRKQDSERKLRGRTSRVRSDSARIPDGIHADSGRIPSGFRSDSVRPDPSRPVPIPTEKENGEGGASAPAPIPTPTPTVTEEFVDEGEKPKTPTVAKVRTRGSRLAADWQPSSETVAAFRAKGIDALATVAEFVDYWIAVAGEKGVKLDWEATFRNHVRRLESYGRAPVAQVQLPLPPPLPPPLTPEQRAEAKLRLSGLVEARYSNA